MAASGFLSYINEPTRISNSTATCIDHFFVKNNLNIHAINIKPKILQTDITDHFAIILDINHVIKKKLPYENRPQVKKINFANLTETLNKTDWSHLYTIDGVNEAYDYFTDTVVSAIDKNSTEIKFNSKHRKLKPWLTLGLIKSIKNRNKLKLQVNKYHRNISLLNKYKLYRNTLNMLIRQTKKDYYTNKLSEHKGNTKKIWQTINESMNSKNRSKTSFNIIHDGQNIESAEQVANLMCDYFTKIGENMAFRIKNDEKVLPNRRLNPSGIFLYPVGEHELLVNIDKLRNSSAPGNDNIQAKTLKTISSFITKPLAYIFNMCFTSGIFPDKMKISVGVPVYKGGNRTSLDNYRLLSLVDNLTKLLEMSIKKRLVEHLNFNKLLSPYQFGFKEGVGTEDALYEVTKNIYNSVDNNKKQVAIFLDLAKAFDSISHKILLTKLYNYGIRGVAYDLLSSYLQNRKLYVRIDSKESEMRSYCYSIPQGTILGPILFSVYINELLYLDTSAKIVSYADDTVVLVNAIDWQEVEREAVIVFSRIKQWLDENSLTLNITKTKFICFSLYNRNAPDIDSLNIHSYNCILNEKRLCQCNEQIFTTNSIKYLGITLDKNLKYTEHMSILNKKIRKLTYKFYQIRHILPACILRMLYFALVESLLRYGIHIWGAAYPTNLHTVKVAQKYVIKVILFKNKTFPSQVLFQEFDVLNIELLYAHSVLMFIDGHRAILDLPDSDICVTRSKTSRDCTIPLFNKSTTQRCLTYHGSKFYNILPLDIKRINNKSLFSKKVKIFISNNGQQFLDILKPL